METSASWSDVKVVARALKEREADRLRGTLDVNSQEILDALKRCTRSDPDVVVLFVDPTDVDKIAVGQKVPMELHVRPGFGVVARNLQHFLQVPRVKIREPKNFVLLDENIASDEVVGTDNIIAKYRKTLVLLQAIKSAGGYLDPDDEKLILFGTSRLDLPIFYSVEDLEALSSKTVDELIGLLPDGVHLKQCQTILIESILEICAPLPEDRRCAVLFSDIKKLKNRFEKSYDLFVSGFSYENVRDEIEAARIEYTSKIHKVFSDIQNQLLGIPVATIIVATQMKPHDKITGDFWTSLAVLLGSLVFGVLMMLLLRNQKHTMDVICGEIARQKKKLEKEHSAIAPNFQAVFQHLEARGKAQRRNLAIVDGIVVLGMLLSLGFFYNLSGPTHEFLHPLREALSHVF